MKLFPQEVKEELLRFLHPPVRFLFLGSEQGRTPSVLSGQFLNSKIAFEFSVTKSVKGNTLVLDFDVQHERNPYLHLDRISWRRPCMPPKLEFYSNN